MCRTKECKQCGIAFVKTGFADKFCLDCRAKKSDRQRFCKSCDAPLPRTQGPKKYCKACAVKAVQLRAQRESIESAVGKVCSVRFIECVECNRLYSASTGYRQKIDVCGAECRAKAYAKAGVEGARWLQYPFQFKLSDSVVAVRSRIRRVVDKAQVGFCCFCGSAKVMGDAAQRNVAKGRRFFCDEECAANWRSVHYASANHKPMEAQRQKTRAKQQQRQEQSERKRREKEAAKALRPKNKKTPGYVTCVQCGNTVWVEQRPDRKYCSKKCSLKAHCQTDSYKASRRESKRNREHIKRSKGIGDRITIPDLMKKHKSRCVNCQTICVKPEGYNWDNEANIDHVLPIAAGGLHIWSNVQLLCRRCNMAKGDKVAKGTQLMLDLRFK
jgi:hypothetical protein